jgi:hypothetical protein
MAVKLKPWVWVVIGIAAICVIGLISMVGVGWYFFTRHIDTKVVSRAGASAEFEQVKVQFVGQKPLIELGERGEFLRSNPDRERKVGSRTPADLYVLAFDPDDERIVKVTIPFWLLRLKAGNGRVDFNGGMLDLEDLKLSVEDLERFGPTLIVDHQGPSGERVLVWSQ